MPTEAVTPAKHTRARLRPELLASALMFAIGLATTYLLWQNAQLQHTHELRDEFDAGIREAELKIERRLSNYQNVLRGLQALYETSREISPPEFASYVATLHLDENHPGIQSMAFSPLVSAEQLERHLGAVRKQGFPDYRIIPAGNRSLYAPVVRIAPFQGRNLRVFGMDNYATPERRAALDQARDSGKASLSGKLMLMQDDNSSEAGILMFMPIYRSGMSRDTPAARRAAIAGWVGASFRMNSLMSGLLDAHARHFGIEIYDGDGASPSGLLYASDSVRDTGVSAAAFRNTRRIEIADKSWTISFASTPAFDARLNGSHAGTFAAIGSLASLILALCTWLLLRSRKRALNGAHLLQDAMQQAEMANRAKNEFLANIGHELRTPINAILGMTHLTLAEETESHKRGRLENIQFSGEHLLNTIDNILDYSGMEYGTPLPHPVDFTLRKLLSEIESIVIPKAAGKDVRLSIDIPPGLSRRRLHGDARRLEQVLLNYLDNAVKFTPHGHIVLRVSIQAEDDTSFKLRFEVQDNGIGIDTENQRHLYSPFWQADNSSTRKHEGIGLGLAICKKLIETMKEGEFGAESAPGSGSTFWFSARLDKARSRRSGQNTAATTAASYAHIKGARILVAEDNALSQTIIGGLLESAGAVVQRARNGTEALELLRRNTFDCVLMDVQMPEMDGMAATRAIRAEPALADLPVIAVTAHASKENRRRCIEAGMNDFIGKPFTPAALYARLAYWLPPQLAPNTAFARTARPEAAATPQDKQARPGDADADIIDLSALSELIGNDRAKMREFANKFIELARGDMAQIEAALADNDHETLGRLAHHHKAPARMVGAQGFADLCQTLSDLSRQTAAPAQIRQAVAQMRPLLDRIEQRVRQELAN